MLNDNKCIERYQLELDHAWFHARQRLIIWAIKKYFSDAHNFLEIGTGTGVMLSGIAKAFPTLTVYGSDQMPDNFPFIANILQQKRLVQLDAAQLPFTHAFDLVGAFDMLEHIDDDRHALREIHRVLKQGGGLILTVPQHPFLWSKFDEYDSGGYGCHKRRYTRLELIDKVSDAGFSIIKTTSFITLLLPAMIATRLLPSKKPITPLTGLKVNPWINGWMDRLLRLEYHMLSKGGDFPWGGSLLLLAKKEEKRL